MKYNKMEMRALSLGGESEIKVASGYIHDRMSGVDTMVDYERMMERREREWCSIIDKAYSVLYGDDWNGGIAAEMSMSHAEVLECIYIQRMSLSETSRRVHWSVRKVTQLRIEAFRYIDSKET